MSFTAICKSEDEDINQLCSLFRALNQSVERYENEQLPSRLTPREYHKNIVRSRNVFGLMMRAFFRKNDENRFQPCRDELDFLKGMVEAVHLCYDLRHRASLTEFYQLLLPGDFVYDSSREKEQYETGIEHINLKGSIFHIDQHTANDRKEFEDLEIRANRLATEIKKKRAQKVHILDGHGRMIVLLMRALEKKEIDLDSITFKVFEIDEVVHEYHKYVFNKRIKKVKGCIINQSTLSRNAMIYLNFCSINSATEFDWTAHFKEQDIENYEWACVKENVLRFIAKSTGVPYNCTVMISFVIRHNHEPFVYQTEFRKTLGDQLTGLGLLYVLLNDFNAEIVSVRPEDQIQWHDPKTRRIPKKLKSGGRGCPFVSLLVKPGDYHRKLKRRFTEGCPFFLFFKNIGLYTSKERRKIADLKEDTIQKDVRVQIVSGGNETREGTVTSRTAAKARVKLDDGKRINPFIQQIKASVTKDGDLLTTSEPTPLRHDMTMCTAISNNFTI